MITPLGFIRERYVARCCTGERTARTPRSPDLLHARVDQVEVGREVRAILGLVPPPGDRPPGVLESAGEPLRESARPRATASTRCRRCSCRTPGTPRARRSTAGSRSRSRASHPMIEMLSGAPGTLIVAVCTRWAPEACHANVARASPGHGSPSGETAFSVHSPTSGSSALSASSAVGWSIMPRARRPGPGRRPARPSGSPRG